MPVLPPPGSAPYPFVQDILDIARVRLNDAISSLGGDVLTNTQPYTQTYTNNAWRRLQEYLANLGYSRLLREVILTDLPVVGNTDPATQVQLSWAGYSDGVSQYQIPVLPPDMILPSRIWERWSNTTGLFVPVEYWIDGLPSAVKQNRNVVWEWRDDAIWMPGSLMLMDLRVRYYSYFPNFVNQDNVQWFQLNAPIMRCEDAFAWLIAYEVSAARGDATAQEFLKNAQEAADAIYNRDVRQKQRANVRRLPRSHRNRPSGWGGNGLGIGSF